MSAMTPVLRVAGLHYRYPVGEPILTDVSFDLVRGERVGIIGRVGAGKTTLLLHLNGLLPEETTHGKVHPGVVEILGMPVNRMTSLEARRLIGYLFQNPNDQFVCDNVGDDVAFGPRQQGLRSAEIERRTRESLEAVGAVGLFDRKLNTLSQGERKLVSLAGVLACDAEVLALDEPTAGLDARGVARLVEVLPGAAATQVIVSGDLQFVAKFCTRVLVLDGGRIVRDGPPEDVLADTAFLESIGL